MNAFVLVAPDRKESTSLVIADVLKARGFRVTCGRKLTEGSWDVVVSWNGSGGDASPGGVTINPESAVRLSRAVHDAAFVLHTHGIPVVPHILPKYAVRPVFTLDPQDMSTWHVHVSDLRVLAIDGDHTGPKLSRWREQRLMEAACRSVYVLGLHFACVHVLIHKSGRWFISHVDPHPDVSPELARAYGASIAKLAVTWHGDFEPGHEVVLGADPEFALFSSEGRLLYASRYVNHRGTVGYDRQSRANRGTYFPLVELRPHPSPSPLVVFTNIEKALHSARHLLPHRRTRWTAGSFPFGKYPTGGHIHFSGPPLTTPLLGALDRYLALPTMLLEHRVRGRRRRTKYGHLGDFRRKEHGGFEYRTLPSWLVSPEATRAMLALAKVVSEEWRQLQSEPMSRARIANEFYRSKKARFRQLFPGLWDAIMRTETAKRYEYQLSYFPRTIRQGVEWKDESDLKQAWWSV